mgnify:CR=1 FL=1
MDSSIEEKRKQSKSYKTIKYDRFPLLLKEKDIIIQESCQNDMIL